MHQVCIHIIGYLTHFTNVGICILGIFQGVTACFGISALNAFLMTIKMTSYLKYYVPSFKHFADSQLLVNYFLVFLTDCKIFVPPDDVWEVILIFGIVQC